MSSQAAEILCNLHQWEIGIWAAIFVCDSSQNVIFAVHSYNVFSFLVTTAQCLFDCAENPLLIWSFNFFLLKEIMEEAGIGAGRESGMVDKYPICICTVSHS